MSFPEVPIGAAFDVFNGATPASGVSDYWDGDIPWVGPADLGKLKSCFIKRGERSITAKGYANCGTQMVPKGAIILSIRAPIGHMAIASEAMCFNQGCRGLVPKPMVRSDFGYWSLLARRQQLEAAGQGTTFIELGRSKLRAERIPLPDLDTQKAIADFLNRETARIDRLIAKRSRFTELLLERRLAVISQAITGTKDDVPWLQTVPEGWRAERAKVHFRESQKRSATGAEELLTVSHITGVTKRSEKDVYMFMAESNEGYKLVAPGDLIINTMWAWMGAMGVSSEHGLISPSYGVYTPISDSFRPAFVNLLVRSKPFVAEATRRSKGIHSSRLRLYPDAFLDMRLPIPPLETQDALLHEISSKAQREDELLRKNARAETLLREFRSALITAAVTGQIDVTVTSDQGATNVRRSVNMAASGASRNADPSQVRRLVAAEIIHDHRNVAYLGRIKVHKIMFLAEAHANINEINGCYHRQAAGPYDSAMIDDVEAGLRQDRFYDAAEDPSSQRGRIAFTPLDNAGAHKPTLEAVLGDRVTELRRIIGLVQEFSTENTEAIATLYAVWNDALLDGEQPDDERIIRGFREEWHEAKQRFTEESLRTWLGWMRRNDLVPRGSGPHTIPAHQPSLF